MRVQNCQKGNASMDKRNILMPLLLLLALNLAACGGADEVASEAVLTEAAQIAIDGLTQTAAAAPPTSTPQATATETAEPSPTVKPTKDKSGGGQTAIPTFTQQAAGSKKPCLRANFEYETVPDGTEYPVGKVFTKTWRLKNTGTCTWNSQTSLVWIKGDLMDAGSVNEFTKEDILPNEYAEITIAFQTPPHPGKYKSYWMLRSSTGETFGVGAFGKAWVWVEITAIAKIE